MVLPHFTRAGRRKTAQSRGKVLAASKNAHSTAWRAPKLVLTPCLLRQGKRHLRQADGLVLASKPGMVLDSAEVLSRDKAPYAARKSLLNGFDVRLF